MMEAVLSLSPIELKTLAASLRTGRLNAPYSASSLSRFFAEPLAISVAAGLQTMADNGMQPAASAFSLEMLASALSEHPSIGDMIDLVMTGPSVPSQAEKTILVAGYAVYQGQKVFHALAERMVECPALKVRMFLDIQRKPSDTSSPAELVRRFAHRFQSEEWPTGKPCPEIFYDPRALSTDRSKRAALHAKCVVADCRDVFVSSANFTEAAQERNVEVGLLLHSTSVAERLTRFFDTLCESGKFARAL
jgi:hypothetical protein